MSLPPAVLAMGALACLLLALALWLFARTWQQEAQQSIHTNLQRSLDIQRELRASVSPLPMADAASLLMPEAAQPQADSPWQWLGGHLRYSAWGIAPRMLALLAAAGLGLALIGALQGGALVGLALLTLYLLLGSFGIWLRLGKRRARMLSQLPGFLDNVVRLISIGNSPHAAFQFACTHIAEPLGGALRQVSASLKVSSDLGQAMAQMERAWGLPEFGLLAAVFRMSTRYGGRADLVLERVSAYIRDRQSAERELHAMSAEVRLSAWILALLPIVVGTLIMVLNEGYFMRMWSDPVGQKLIFAAGGLQMAGSFLLYRLARLK